MPRTALTEELKLIESNWQIYPLASSARMRNVAQPPWQQHRGHTS